jgi:hypothetical protein
MVRVLKELTANAVILDLVIIDELDRKTLGEIWMEVNSSDFPLTVDLQVWKDIKNENLKEHIHRVGKVFYSASRQKSKFSLVDSVAF